ncbi:hypothetical protein NEIFLAOT_01367 [Neisseria flavescens NRL30031/H210]|uniref:Uncharacterized protein n=1 Tax=Neisseria flavescens NRL30031/H210 TaxID=546264 RepID=C0EN35_NEIFL|nr:hypothetical protein NEIFLAOT_01367 [Neisseria flavescens NRL30031/H210]
MFLFCIPAPCFGLEYSIFFLYWGECRLNLQAAFSFPPDY